MKDVLKGIIFVALFALPFIPLIVSDSLFFPFITGKNFTFRILVEIAFTAWILLALYDRAYRPRFSWIVASFTVLLGVMALADAFGEFPLKSFWSNFERMEGYVTLVHVYLLLLVAGSVFKEKAWLWFFNTTLFAASILSLYAFAQLSGTAKINQGGWRVDGTLGNAAYMAVYMLFHTFIALYLALKSKNLYGKLGYGALMVLFAYLLVQTATRGTILGLVGGLALMSLYIALFAKQSGKIRTYATSGVVVVTLLVLGFMAIKDTTFVQENPILKRVAAISLEEGATRFQIWGLAWEGVQERPLLGWGQGNFNYVFNKYYSPELYDQEPWFDRVHNIVMDWLVAGGVLGLLAYLAVLGSAVYYVAVRPRFGDERFGVLEQGLLLGLLAAYFVHNLFVFDNIVSYMFYGCILAFIHSRVAVPWPKVEAYVIPQKLLHQMVVPTVVVVAAAIMYQVNVPAIQAAGDIIDGFTATTPQQMLNEFESALARHSFADQEIREQLTQRAQQALSGSIADSDRSMIIARTEAELLKQIEEKPGDARIHVFVSSFYRLTNQYDKAREQLVIAHDLSPKKQQIIYEQGFVELQAGKYDDAKSFFKEAFELEEQNKTARTYYAAALLYAGDIAEATSLVSDEADFRNFSKNDIALSGARQAGAYDLLIRAAEQRVVDNPADLQTRVGLASVYYEAGDVAQSIAVLEETIERFPSFKKQGEGYIADLKAGRRPGSASVSATAGSEPVEVSVE